MNKSNYFVKVARSPAPGLDTSLHTNASALFATPGRHTRAQSKLTCVSDNVVYVIKCRTSNKVCIGESGGTWLKFLGKSYARQGYQTQISPLAATKLPKIGVHFLLLFACVSVVVDGFT